MGASSHLYGSASHLYGSSISLSTTVSICAAFLVATLLKALLVGGPGYGGVRGCAGAEGRRLRCGGGWAGGDISLRQ